MTAQSGMKHKKRKREEKKQRYVNIILNLIRNIGRRCVAHRQTQRQKEIQSFKSKCAWTGCTSTFLLDLRKGFTSEETRSLGINRMAPDAIY